MWSMKLFTMYATVPDSPSLRVGSLAPRLLIEALCYTQQKLESSSDVQLNNADEIAINIKR